MSARYLGIDYGTRRIGLAVSDPGGDIASPLRTCRADGGLEKQVQRVIEAVDDYGVDEWVVGLPLNMDGSNGPQADVVREFSNCLARTTDAPVHLWDERLSSCTADAHMARSGLTYKKKKRRRDAVAAQVILQSFLDARPDNR